VFRNTTRGFRCLLQPSPDGGWRVNGVSGCLRPIGLGCLYQRILLLSRTPPRAQDYSLCPATPALQRAHKSRAAAVFVFYRRVVCLLHHFTRRRSRFMPQKLIFTFVFICAAGIGTSARLLGAEQIHPPNPKRNSMQQEQSTSPDVRSQRNADQQAPGHALTEKEIRQQERRCSWDVASVGCQPPPGSPLSAFPLVSSDNPTPLAKQP
jgi:hypothetical protein